MQEVDQRFKNELIIACNCGSYHYLHFSFCKDKEWGSDFWISVIDRPASLWDRIKQAVNHIVKGGDLWACEVGLTEKNLYDIKEIIDKYLYES